MPSTNTQPPRNAGAHSNKSQSYQSNSNQEIVRFLNTPEAKQRLLGIGSEVLASSAEQFDAVIRADIARLVKVIKEANIKVE